MNILKSILSKSGDEITAILVIKKSMDNPYLYGQKDLFIDKALELLDKKNLKESDVFTLLLKCHFLFLKCSKDSSKESKALSKEFCMIFEKLEKINKNELEKKLSDKKKMILYYQVFLKYVVLRRSVYNKEKIVNEEKEVLLKFKDAGVSFPKETQLKMLFLLELATIKGRKEEYSKQRDILMKLMSSSGLNWKNAFVIKCMLCEGSKKIGNMEEVSMFYRNIMEEFEIKFKMIRTDFQLFKVAIMALNNYVIYLDKKEEYEQAINVLNIFITLLKDMKTPNSSSLFCDLVLKKILIFEKMGNNWEEAKKNCEFLIGYFEKTKILSRKKEVEEILNRIKDKKDISREKENESKTNVSNNNNNSNNAQANLNQMNSLLTGLMGRMNMINMSMKSTFSSLDTRIESLEKKVKKVRQYNKEKSKKKKDNLEGQEKK